MREKNRKIAVEQLRATSCCRRFDSNELLRLRNRQPHVIIDETLASIPSAEQTQVWQKVKSPPVFPAGQQRCGNMQPWVEVGNRGGPRRDRMCQVRRTAGVDQCQRL